MVKNVGTEKSLLSGTNIIMQYSGVEERAGLPIRKCFLYQNSELQWRTSC